VTCVPQSYAWGSEAQVDWYEAVADVEGTRQTLQVFGLRSMASGGAFHRAYTHATQQAFLEAHEAAFADVGGVFHRLRYDNLPLAVKRILRGREREQTTRFIAFRSHWRFAAEFCTPGEGHEKGGVEGEAGYFRRNHWVPIPQAPDLAALNAQLLQACEADWHRIIAGRAQPVGPLMQLEQPHLLPLAAAGFDLAEVSFPRVDGLGCVKVRTNAYSVPVRVGTQVEARVYPTAVEVWHAGHCLARHARCYGQQQQVLDLEHYLDVLEHKPGALAGATPLAQWRAQGRWPASYDQLWTQLQARQGRQAGTRATGRLGSTAAWRRRWPGAVPIRRRCAICSRPTRWPTRRRSRWTSGPWPCTTGRSPASTPTTSCWRAGPAGRAGHERDPPRAPAGRDSPAM
jgi:hypothetical protein